MRFARNALWMIGFIGVLTLLSLSQRGMTVLALALLLVLIFPSLPGAVVKWIGGWFKSDAPDSGKKPDLPIPPQLGGMVLFMGRYFLAVGLMHLVPRMWPQMRRQIQGDALARGRAIDNPADYEQKGHYRLPFDGVWYIHNGGMTPDTSHSWDIIAQRYAYDFVMTDEVMRRWRTDGKSLSDYLCYGQPILAIGDGEVVAVIDDVRDAPGVGIGWIDIFTTHFPGNAVTIRHAAGEYSFYAHLIPGRIPVYVGQQVHQGEVVGHCGHSGHSTEPHLHFQLQDHEDFYLAAGLPIQFENVIVDGHTSTDTSYLTNGIHVSMRLEPEVRP